MPRADAVVPDLVRLGLAVPDVPALFRAVTDDLAAQGLIDAAAAAARALEEREAVHSTALGAGVALPHARTAAARVPRWAFVRLGTAIEFDSPDGLPVDLAFVLLSPPHEPGEHVKQLARLARLLQEPGFAQRLRAAPDEAAFRALIEDAGTAT